MSFLHHRRFIATWFVVLIMFELSASPLFAAIRYVNANLATGGNNGTTWEDAHQGASGLETALIAAVDGDQVWVAQGSYKPGPPSGLSFRLQTGVQVYGGFVGDELALEERDFIANPTILTGDILGNDVPGSHDNTNDNSRHVVHGNSANATAVLDGFIITAGFAKGPKLGSSTRGGGMYFVDGSNATIRNCIIEYNHADFVGGGVFVAGSSPTFIDVVVRNNHTATFAGGGMAVEQSSPTFNRCQFISNQATRGGGIDILSSSATLNNCLFLNNAALASTGGGLFVGSNATVALRNCTFAYNTSASSGAGIFNNGDSTTIYNSIFWNNTGPGGATVGQQISGTNTVQYSIVQNGFAGTANLSVDPQFVSATDLHIQATSPAIDSGNNSLVPATITEDLDHNPRKVDDPDTTDTGVGTPPLVDRGAYEFTPVIALPCPADIAPKGGNGTVDVDDLLVVINSWGATGAGLPGDITGNEVIDVDDLLAVINGWGTCK